MRTTLVLDDDVARAARHRAVELGITLGELVTRALRELLREPPATFTSDVQIPRYGDPHRPTQLTPEQIAEALTDQEFER